MKKPEISFRHFDGSGPLSIYWHDGLMIEVKVTNGKVSIVKDKKNKAG